MQVDHVLSERQLLEACSHPFICNLVSTYQDADSLYLLLEMLHGGELLGLLRSQQYFQDSIAAFYAAIACSVFEYLHDRKIVYRDLRPENMLLDSVIP